MQTFHKKSLSILIKFNCHILSFCFIKISNSLHSLYVRVKICVMTYLNVKGQGQIDIFNVTEVNFVIILLNAQITFSPLVPP